MLKIKAVFFDLDGTLIDTEPSAEEAIRRSFKKWKVKVKEEDVQSVTGITWNECFKKLFPKYKLPVSVEEAGNEILEAYRAAIREDLHLIPGGAQAVQVLAKGGFELALVSGSHRAEILWALKQLDVLHHFREVLGAEDYPQSKPAPDGYQKAAQLIQVKPDEVLVFEDSRAGVASARAAGMWVAAISHANHWNQDTSAAHWQIQDLTGVDPQWVRSLNSTGGK